MNHPRHPNPTVLIALLATCWLGQAAAVDISGGTEQDRQRMVEIAQQWVSNYLDGDLDSMMTLMDEDAMIMAEGQATVRGTEAVRAFLATRVGQPGVRFHDDLQEIRIKGDWAFVRGAFALEVAPREEGQEPYRRKGRYLVLYEKNEAGEWLMLRDMDNAAPMAE